MNEGKKYYNLKGMEIKQALYKIDQNPPLPNTQQPVQSQQAMYNNYLPSNNVQYYTQPQVIDNSVPIIKFNPSDKFGLNITRDQNMNYDFKLRFNPKSFFVVATEIISCILALRKTLSGFKK